jgi:hypothetical protein
MSHVRSIDDRILALKIYLGTEEAQEKIKRFNFKKSTPNSEACKLFFAFYETQKSGSLRYLLI